MVQRMVVTGAAGQVGRCLVAEASRSGYDVVALGRRDLDITDHAAVADRLDGADVVVNCAALSNVDACETDQQAAHAINALGPGYLARACARVGARLVHISTDYVFNGDSRRPYEISDATAPMSVYGRSKLAGELAVHAELPDAHVVRTSWVFTGGSGADFVAVMQRLAAGDGFVDVIADQTGSPTYVKDLAGALLEVAAGKVSAPLVHAANAGEASRFDQARAVFAEVGADPDRVRPVATAAVPRIAHRPVYSPLSMAESARAGLTPLRPWREALSAAIDAARSPANP